MILGFHADPQPGDAAGARYAYRRVLRWDLSEGPLDRGLAWWREHEADRTQESLRMFAASVDKALDYLSEEADSLHVFWPHAAFERWLDEQAIDEASPEGKAATPSGPRCSAATPTASIQRRRRCGRSPSETCSPGSSASGVPQTAR